MMIGRYLSWNSNMTKTAMIRARTEAEFKQQVEEILQSLVLNQTEAINMFYHQVVLHRELPFDVKLPNKETTEAIESARKKEGEVFVSAKIFLMILGFDKFKKDLKLAQKRGNDIETLKFIINSKRQLS